MAVALSLLIVLPGLAQTTSNLTDGKQGVGDISVGVFEDIADAQLAKLRDADASGLPGGEPGVFVPVEAAPVHTLGVEGQQRADNLDPAFLVNDVVSPRDTFFNSTLYVSNNVGAFNTVLINVENDEFTDTCVPDNTDTDVDESEFGTPRLTATVRNARANQSIEVQLVRSSTAENFQAFFKVVEQGDTGTFDPTPTDTTNDDAREVAFTQHGGPTWCDDERETRHVDDDDNPSTPANDDAGTSDDIGDRALDTPIQLETEATIAVYGPVVHLVNAAPETQQEIATIFATQGDRLTVTTSGGSGQVTLVVDGDGPDFSAIAPEDNTVSRPNRLSFSFEVRDDDSGLRHDGESVISPDDDYAEINPDGDQFLSDEPLSMDPGTAVSSNGASEDIDVHVVANPNDGMGNNVEYRDISASGTWRLAGSRAGVAYAFTASGADRPDDSFLYQLEATDRAGNTTVTDADDRLGGNQPYVFRVDDTEPELSEARTGISYDREDNEEIVDRSYIALSFTDGEDGADALGDVDTDSITVVGHTIVGVIHPNKAPAINRNMGAPDRMDYTPTATLYTPAMPTTERPTVGDLSDARGAVLADRTPPQLALLLLNGRWTQYAADVTAAAERDTNGDASAPVLPVGQGITESADCATPATVVASSDVEVCGRWAQYKTDKALYDAGVKAEEDADAEYAEDLKNYETAREPGTDINGESYAEPRSRIYLQLAEDLASDAEPTVQVVGGAVFDLAGNTNPAITLGEAEDWIAPGLTVTVTGTAADRPVANDEGSFSIDVRSDEDLAGRPAVYFVSLAAALNDDEDGYDYTAAAVETGNSLTQQEDENHWARTYKVSSADLADFEDGLVGVIVVADDQNNENSGATDGWSPGSHQEAASPADDDGLDPGDMDDAGLIIEIDDDMAAAAEQFVTPRSKADGTETENSNPFVKLDFDDEGSEYEVCPAAVCDGDVDTEFEDSHGGVNVTEVTLNGDDVISSLARVSSNEFSLVLRDLAVDTYKVDYTAVDDAGNEHEGTFTFKVVPREPYQIKVSPGWNLISLPADPLEPEIGSVLANNPYISPVLGYQEGDWVTAIQEEDGTWRGRLAEITGGYGYWIHARTFETIETMLSETDPASTLPTVPVAQGWNLLGVLDVYQNDTGEAPGEAGGNGDEADNYLGSISWRVAYTYATDHSLWVKTVPKADTNVIDPETGNPRTTLVDHDDDPETDEVPVNVTEHEIVNGKGYWVWSATPGTLAP